jgi:5'-3' exonuclease
MGILFFYSWLIKTAREAFRVATGPESYDVVALDLNGVLHRTLETGLVTLDGLRARCFQLLDEILSLVGKDAKLVVACLDGVAPRAKMNQQRARRHLSPTPAPGALDSNMLSPGTEAMEHAASFLRLYFAERAALFPRVLVSDSRDNGEGEHKIAALLRRLPGRVRVCVYGADSDLVFLGGLARRHAVTIVRECHKPCRACQGMHRSELCRKELRLCRPFEFLDVGVLRAMVAEQFGGDPEQVWRDLTLVTMWVGNDFVPRHPLFQARSDLSTLWSCLWALQQSGCRLTDESGRLHAPSLARFVRALQELEGRKIGDFVDGGRRKGKPQEEMEIPVATLEEALTGSGNGGDNRERLIGSFRQTYLRDCPSDCGEYVRTLQWVLQYYTRDTSDWRWCYARHYAPLCAPLLAHLEALGDTWIEAPPPNPRPPFTAAEQLFLIMPRRCIPLLPESYQSLAQQLFPESFAFDNRFSAAAHDLRPLLPFWDAEAILGQLASRELSAEEFERMGGPGRAFELPEALAVAATEGSDAVGEMPPCRGLPLLSRRVRDVGVQLVTGKIVAPKTAPCAAAPVAAAVVAPKAVAVSEVVCVGCRQDKPGCFVSDCDEELLVSFVLPAAGRVASVRLEKIQGTFAPDTLKVVLNNRSLSCEDYTSGAARVALEARLGWTADGSVEVALPAHTFQRVSVLSLFFSGAEEPVGVRIALK